MTFVGKILVIVIMAFSLLFLALSTVVFTTSKNWMAATKDEQKKVEEFKKKLQDSKAVAEAANKELADAKAAAAAETKALNNTIASLQDENKRRRLDEITAVRGQVVAATQTAESTLQEVEAKRQETNLLRTQKAAVEKQANEFKLRQAELNDHIRDLERTLDTATKHNSDLRERVAKFSTLLRQNGLSDDITQIKGLESPPPVTGEVKRIDQSNRRLEVTIGSDDGLVVGHELFIYRTTPRPEYIGKAAIVTVEPDQAVAKVVGNTFQGKKIKEGDIVSSTIKPQF